MSRRLMVVVFVLAVAIMAGLLAGCGGNLPGDAVAKVGDTYIAKADFDQRVEQIAKQYGVSQETDPEYYEVLKSEVLDIMVENAVAAAHAQEVGLAVTDEEVQAEIDSMLSLYYGGDQALLEADLESADMTMEQFQKEYKEYLLSGKVYEDVTKDITEVPDEDVVAYYEASKDSYYTPETRTVRHILIMPGVDDSPDTTTTSETSGETTTTTLTDQDWAEALATANQVRDKLVHGGDWTALAAEYSDDTYSKDSGGELGAVGKGEMVQEFEDSVFSLEPYEISEPVRTMYGYHVIQVTGVTEADQKTLDEVRTDIEANLVDQAKYEAWTTWLDEMKVKLGIIYREDLAPTTTTVAPAETTTTSADSQPITTAAPETTEAP